MNRLNLLAALLCIVLPVTGQNISVTFTGTGDHVNIDSVTAINLSANVSVTLPGNETLILSVFTGNNPVDRPVGPGMVYPNPFPGKAIFAANVEKPGIIHLKIQNLFGQILAHTHAFVPSGEHEFAISVDRTGIFLVTLITEAESYGFTAICTEAVESGSNIRLINSGSTNRYNQNNPDNPAPVELKSSRAFYNLHFAKGETILFKCFSGVCSTIMTDSPSANINYEVEFTSCKDPDGKNYPIFKSGNQVWMAENLAYLPSVRTSLDQSYHEPMYYVYNYEGRRIDEARNSESYHTYGVLYNWPAAMTACPSGWHLPNDEEWKILEQKLGMSVNDLRLSGWRISGSVGKKMKSTYSWMENGNGNNSSGFTALPGGYRQSYEGFYGLFSDAGFWSATGIDLLNAFTRNLFNSHDAIGRNEAEKITGYSVRCVKNGYTIPTAGFTWSPSIGTPSTIFEFDASASNDLETSLKDLEVRWDWNGDSIWDTSFGKVKKYSHQFNSTGSHSILLEVRDADGFADTVMNRVAVGEGSFTDTRDGHEYIYNTIGSQTWTIQNLAYLPAVSPEISDSGTEKLYHVYDYNGTDIQEAKRSENYKLYGVLYNWPAAMNGEPGSISNPSGVQGVCPQGWHLPGDAEWNVLTDFLGNSAGKHLKAGDGWKTGNGDNYSVFTAIPGGLRFIGDGFYYKGSNACFWTATSVGSTDALFRYLDEYYDGVIRDIRSKNHGFSVRCLQD